MRSLLLLFGLCLAFGLLPSAVAVGQQREGAEPAGSESGGSESGGSESGGSESGGAESGGSEPAGSETADAAEPDGEGGGQTPGTAAGEVTTDPFAGPDLGPLREELTGIMDELVQARSRIATLGRQLFRTKVRIRVANEVEDFTLSRIAVRLDGAPVVRRDGLDGGDEAQQLFEGFAAPGPHTVTIETEQRARADSDYRYTLRDRFRFEVRRDRLTEVTIVLDDDSDIAEDFPDDEEGEYSVETELRVATRELDAE